MTGRFKIDGTDAWTQWKVYVLDGGYTELACLPPMKEVETNDWNEFDGLEADLSSPVGDARSFTMNFACSGQRSDFESFISYLRTPYTDSDGVNHGVYHTLDCAEIGGRQVVARLVSLGNTNLGAMRPPLIFPLTFSDDSGFIYDSSIDIPEASSEDTADYSLDGIPFTAFGIKILENTIDGIRSGSGVKDGLSVGVSDIPGLVYDKGSYQKRRSRNITLYCLMRAASLDSFWSSYASFENLLFKPGERLLRVSALEASYRCHYVSCNVQNFYPSSAWMMFSLTFKILGWS